MSKTSTPRKVTAGMRRLGEDLRTTRKLHQLTGAQVADRAGLSRHTVMRLEAGQDVSLENVLRIARALGVLDLLVASVDPHATDVGRLRYDESLPQRVRPRPMT